MFEGRAIVGVTGGTSTPIEDLRDVAQRVLEIAGTPEGGPRRGARRGGPRRRRDPGRPDDLASRSSTTSAPPRRRGIGPPWPPRARQPAVVAVVGRPNVGKSTIFNRFVGKRQAIVEDRARTTRDRMYGDMEWNGRRFVIVDTGGLEVDTDDPIEVRVQEQARLAIREADVIVFVVDAVSGLTPADQEAAELLRTAKAPVIVAVNKVDNTQREADAAEFWSMGWEETYSISASHGRGTGDLLDAIVWALRPKSSRRSHARSARTRPTSGPRRSTPGGSSRTSSAMPATVDPTRRRKPSRPISTGSRAADAGGEIEARWDAAIAADAKNDNPAAIAFVGRPNVGKSSLVNASSARTGRSCPRCPARRATRSTRPSKWGRSEIVLIDTAGIRRRGKAANGPAAEKLLDVRAVQGDRRSDVAVLVIDAVEGLTAQDAHVAATSSRKAAAW